MAAGPWIPSAGAPPGAPAAYADKRLSTIGTVCIVLAAAQLAWFVYSIAAAAIGMLAVDLGSSWLSSKAPGPFPPEMKQLSPHAAVPTGGGFQLQCAWNNTSDATIKFGESALAEMCFFWAYYYPYKPVQSVVLDNLSPEILKML